MPTQDILAEMGRQKGSIRDSPRNREEEEKCYIKCQKKQPDAIVIEFPLNDKGRF